MDYVVLATAVGLAAASYQMDNSLLLAAAGVIGLAHVVLRQTVGYANEKRVPVLSKDDYKFFPLREKILISHNTAIYRFALPKPDDVLGLPIGQHISIAAEIGGKEIVRSYTPTTADDDLGHFDLLIKTYPQGNISKFIQDLKIGQTIKVKGPKGFFKWTPNAVRALGMIAGGTGITPMLQIIKAIVKNPADKTQVDLIFANVKFEDILLKDELDELAKNHDNFRVHYVLNEPPSEWNGSVGFVSKELIEKVLPKPADDVKILICGPPPMVKAMTGYTEELGFPKANAVSKMNDTVFKF
ncbi:NADH-cytochrome b5 reductase [Rhizophlyctis rosea]|uniref:NADH-cytochrome b5 reductase n=1 Tax=Rhizophlyctis rosea TaxID=64517 RepID=A0AAD5X107_9FUNG|nr:NADH-cytochrome b5 reductase [Rhizophlyctis rosea]